MAQHVKIAGASYANVPAVKLPLIGGGEALFMDASNYRTSAAQDIIDATKAEIDLLWTNASPSSSFDAQTISLDLSGYTLLLFLANIGTWGGGVSAISAVGNSAVMTTAHDGTLERVFYTSTTAITIDDGYIYASYNGNRTKSNTALIPTAIYGIK